MDTAPRTISARRPPPSEPHGAFVLACSIQSGATKLSAAPGQGDHRLARPSRRWPASLVSLILRAASSTRPGQREALAMQCPSCGRDNPPGAGFCSNCGIQLAAEEQCAACQHRNPSEAQFCDNCGTVLRCPNCSRSHVGEGRFCRWCQQFLVVPHGVKAAGIGRRVAAYILDIILFFVTLMIGYIVWWVFYIESRPNPWETVSADTRHACRWNRLGLELDFCPRVRRQVCPLRSGGGRGGVGPCVGY